MFAPARLLSTLIYLAATIAVFLTSYNVSFKASEMALFLINAFLEKDWTGFDIVDGAGGQFVLVRSVVHSFCSTISFQFIWYLICKNEKEK